LKDLIDIDGEECEINDELSCEEMDCASLGQGQSAEDVDEVSKTSSIYAALSNPKQNISIDPNQSDKLKFDWLN